MMTKGKNEYFIKGDIAEMVLYHKGGSEKCRSILDTEDVERCSDYRWYCNNGYIVRYAGSSRKNRPELKLHDFLLDFKGTRKVKMDHRNQDTLDNRKLNLRICTHQQNMMNKLRKPGVSGFSGVGKCGLRWRAKIKHDGNYRYIGSFGTAVEAAKAWNKKALEFRGEFAVLNPV